MMQTSNPPQTQPATTIPARKPLLIQARVDLCPIKESAKIIGKKWYLVLIHRLMGRKMGFNELKEAVGDISAKILSQSLQDLQEKGIVDRRVASASPIRVEYSLTEKGADLNRVLIPLYDWGKKWAVCKNGQPVETPHRFRSPPLAAPTPSSPPATPG